MEQLVDYAIKYAKLGLAVFPLKENNKAPLTANGFKDATKDIGVIKNWWKQHPKANIGIATGLVSGIAVIDLDEDSERGISGYETMNDWMIKEGCVFPDTWQSITGRGGYHIIFKTNKPIKSRIGVMDGIDIRADGGYIVAPPSIHPNGTQYEWEYAPDETELCAISDDEDVEYFFNVINLKGAESKTLEVPEKIEKGGRNDMLYRLACSLQAKGFSDTAIKEAIKAENELKCVPPLPAREINTLVNSALTKEKGTAVKNDKPTNEKPLNKPETGKKTPSLKVTSAQDLNEMELPEIYYAVEGMIPQGETVIAAPPKTGKSWLVLDMLIQISKGEPFLGFNTNKSDTLYLALEDGINFEQERLKIVLNGKEAPSNFHFVFEGTMNLANGFLEQLDAVLAEYPTIKVIVIDTLYFVKYSMNKNDTAYECDYRTGRDLKNYADAHGISIIVVTHTTKLKHVEDDLANVSGTNGVTGASDAVVVIDKKQRQDTDATLFITGRRVRQSMHKIEFKPDCKWHYISATDGKEEKNEQAEREQEYFSSDIRAAVVEMASWNKSWKGTAGGFIEEAIRNGLGIIESAQAVGRFLGQMQGLFLAKDGISVEVIKNGSGGRSYKFGLFQNINNEDNPFAE